MSAAAKLAPRLRARLDPSNGPVRYRVSVLSLMFATKPAVIRDAADIVAAESPGWAVTVLTREILVSLRGVA